MLLGAGYYFYACWNAKCLLLLILSTVVDYGCGIVVDRATGRSDAPDVVVLSMAINLGVLGYFKYYNFFAESLLTVLGRLGLNVSLVSSKSYCRSASRFIPFSR